MRERDVELHASEVHEQHAAALGLYVAAVQLQIDAGDARRGVAKGREQVCGGAELRLELGSALHHLRVETHAGDRDESLP